MIAQRFSGHLVRYSSGLHSLEFSPLPEPSSAAEQIVAACERALASDDIVAALRFLASRSLGPTRALELLDETARTERPAREFVDARAAARTTQDRAAAPGAIERALLVHAVLRVVRQVPTLPVDASVKGLLYREFQAYAAPPPDALGRFDLEELPFIAMTRIVTLRRFPGGAFDWEPSGFPHRWLLKVPPRLMARTLRFLALETRGFAPLLVWHLSGTVYRQRFLLEAETRRSFYRVAAAAERQPAVRGLMAASWLMSTETHRINPHLADIGRPFIEAGGLHTDIGPAPATNGFLTGDPRRRQLYERGEYRPTIGVLVCSRQQAIRWVHAHPELETDSRVEFPIRNDS
jgi:hypothetical protein